MICRYERTERIDENRSGSSFALTAAKTRGEGARALRRSSSSRARSRLADRSEEEPSRFDPQHARLALTLRRNTIRYLLKLIISTYSRIRLPLIVLLLTRLPARGSSRLAAGFPATVPRFRRHPIPCRASSLLSPNRYKK